MKILYITQRVPFGRGEAFIIPEILEVIKKGHNITIFPVRPNGKVFHKEAYQLVPYTYASPIINLKIVFFALLEVIVKPLVVSRILFNIIRNSRNLRILLKNLFVFPKALYGAYLFKRQNIYHIHAHWASTSSTVAYIISRLLGCLWSFTAHSWDITEDNMLALKVKDAKFVRCISKYGSKEVIKIAHLSYPEKIKIIHMGVYFSQINNVIEERKPIIFLTPANLIPVKGHTYLLQACRLLLSKKLDFKVYLAGKGPLRSSLMEMITRLDLKENVIFLGELPHDELINFYSNGKVDVLVLPSIVTEKGAKEGIPVSLMEAMSFKIPVISTDTGAISELLEGDAGLMVTQKNPEELAIAMFSLGTNLLERKRLSDNGFKIIYERFNVERETGKLLSEM